MAVLRILAALFVAGMLASCAARGDAPSSGAPQPAPASFAGAEVAKGAELAAIGNCVACHTAKGGRPFAGGTPIATPFGTVYGSNLTPDRATGIGGWSEADFRRALRKGVDDDGERLFPAFPYDHFTLLTDDDIRALYAFVMTREPVRNPVPEDEVKLPRFLVRFWDALYLKEGPYKADPSRSAQWNRGAYLVQGAGHCGGCHTPRNRLGAEEKDRRFAGASAEGWRAPALNAASPAPRPWTKQALFAYLRGERPPEHGVPAGPMAGVVRHLAGVPDDDLRAMAVYLASLQNGRPERPVAHAAAGGTSAAGGPGEAIYKGACASCHSRGRDAKGGALSLELATAPRLRTPDNLVRIIRGGIVPPPGEAGPWMPAFGASLTDAQLTDLVTYLRQRTGLPAWNVAEAVRRKGSS